MKGKIPLFVAAVLVIGACRSGDVGSTPGTGTWRATGTTVPGVEPVEGSIDLSLATIEDVDSVACPNVALPAQESLALDVADQQIASAQDEIRADMERLQGYISQHRDDMGDASYLNGVPMRIGVTIADNVEQHCLALRSILEHPDRLEIEVGLSQETLEALVVEIQRDWPHSGYVASPQGGRVVAHLWPGEEEAAKEMTERYGDAIELWLGRQRYPDGLIREECLAWLSETVDPFVEVQLPPVGVEFGGRYPGVATIFNPGPDDVTLEDVWLEAVVVERGTTTALAVVTGATPSEVMDPILSPNESTEATFVGGTASCDPMIGFTLPPGEYEYRVLVLTHPAPEIDDLEPIGFWSDPASLKVG